MGYLCANFSLLRPLCSRLRPYVRDRQTDVRQTDVRRAASLNASALWGWGHNNFPQSFADFFASSANLATVRVLCGPKHDTDGLHGFHS